MFCFLVPSNCYSLGVLMLSWDWISLNFADSVVRVYDVICVKTSVLVDNHDIVQGIFKKYLNWE